MKYPDEFDTSSFPAGKQIAVSRAVGIATMVVFLLIVIACGLLLWMQKSTHIHPFLISINDITGRWEIVGHHHTETKEITTTQSLQESVIGKFLEYRFTITNNDAFNSKLWQLCDRETDCNPEIKSDSEQNSCVLFCLSSDGVYNDFVTNIVPKYQSQVSAGETWTIDMSSVNMLPVGQIVSSGGTWQIRITVYSNVLGPMNILAYANIAQNLDLYPKTMGYYVEEFNAYKIN